MRITYIGRRTVKGKLTPCFLKDENDDLTYSYYPKAKSSLFKGCIIGVTYEIEDNKFPDLNEVIERLRAARQSLGTPQKRSAFDAWLMDRLK